MSDAMKPSYKLTAGKAESFWVRLLWALPLLAIFFVGRTALDLSLSKLIPLMEQVAKTGYIDDVSRKIPVRKVYTGIEGLDGFVSLFVAFFTPALAGLDDQTITSPPSLGQYGNLYAPQRLQSITFLADFACLNAILAIESCRRGNSMTIASVPVIFGVAMQLKGGGQIIPLYLFLQYISLPPSKYTLRSSRLVPIRYAKTLLPALILGYIIPTICCFWPTSSLSTKQACNYFWQFFPIWIALSHELFARCFKDVPFSSKGQGKGDTASDLVWLRGTYEFVFLLSAAMYLYVFFSSPIPFSEVFFGGIWDVGKEIGFVKGTEVFLKWDEICVFAGMGTWILLCFRDLKREGRTDAGWLKLVVFMLGTGVLFGPGASMAVLCAWREEILVGEEGKRE